MSPKGWKKGSPGVSRRRAIHTAHAKPSAVKTRAIKSRILRAIIAGMSPRSPDRVRRWAGSKRGWLLDGARGLGRRPLADVGLREVAQVVRAQPWSDRDRLH